MAPTLIILVLAALGVGLVVWAARKKSDGASTGPQEDDTAWNDPVAQHESLPADPLRPASSSEETRP